MASSTGHSYSLILEDGSIVSAGYNTFGELGLGYNYAVKVFTPVPSAGIDNIKVVHGSNSSGASFILKSNGDLYVTGHNDYGQLGIGVMTLINTYTFVMSDVKDVSVSAYHTLVLKKDGTVWATGYNYGGELGLGHKIQMNEFTEIVSLGNDNSFICSGQYYHSYVVKRDGRLFFSGSANYSPGIGGSTTFKEVLSMGDDNLYVAASYGAVILKKDGRVFSFGTHHGGKPNNGTPTEDTELGNDNISVVAAQNNYYVLKSNGEVWGVADNVSYHTYTGITNTSAFTKATKFGEDNIDFGINRTQNGFFALKRDGLVYGSGANAQGQLGLGNTTAYATPQLLFDGKKVKAISGTILRNKSIVTTMVSYSIDGINFSSFMPLDSNNIPQARFLKFRSEFSGGNEEGKVVEKQFDQADPETAVQLNEFLENINTDIKMKTTYTQPFIQGEDYESGMLFKAEVNKNVWKSIKQLNTK